MIETTRDRLEIVSNRVAILEEGANKKFQDAGVLRSLCTKLHAEILTEEKLLAGKWIYIPDKYTVRLEAVDELDGFPKVRELLGPLHNHENYSLWEGTACLRIDDEVLTLCLPTKTAIQFIREHGIMVDMTAAFEHRDKLTERTIAINTLLAEMGE